MVPTFEKFLYPFLLFLKEGELTIQEMREKLIKYFNLSEEDLQIRTKSGRLTQFNDILNLGNADRRYIIN